MKHQIIIYSNLNNYFFIKQVLPKYHLVFKKIEELRGKKNVGKFVIFYNDKKSKEFDIKNISGDYLLITNSDTNNIKNSKKTIVTNNPLTTKQIKNLIENFVFDSSSFFEDISLIDKKLSNVKNNKHCFLTEIEKDILIYLIETKVCSREHIKKNILKIKLDIETSSIDSHLTRIRKKFYKIDTSLVIESKNDLISIYPDQKKLD